MEAFELAGVRWRRGCPASLSGSLVAEVSGNRAAKKHGAAGPGKVCDPFRLSVAGVGEE